MVATRFEHRQSDSRDNIRLSGKTLKYEKVRVRRNLDHTLF